MSYSNPADQKAYARLYYRRHKKLFKARAKAHSKRTRAEISEYITRYKLAHPCADCGEDDPVCLDFDHRPGEKKLFTVGEHYRTGHCLASVIKEIAKCDVRCSNCHRKRHARETK